MIIAARIAANKTESFFRPMKLELSEYITVKN
jgi:hypothetical protein